MNLDGLLSTFSPEVRESPSMKGLVILIQTLLEQLQATQEQLTKAQEKIKTLEDELAKLRKTPKRPKFCPNGMQPRDHGNKSGRDLDKIPPSDNVLLAKKETSEVMVKPLNIPDGSRCKGYQTFAIQDINLIAKEFVHQLEVWQSPAGDILRGKLREELKGQHFGSTLRAFTTNLYAQGVTQPAIHEFLRSIGKKQVHKLYDALVAMKTSSPEINAVINNFSMYQEEMLKALSTIVLLGSDCAVSTFRFLKELWRYHNFLRTYKYFNVRPRGNSSSIYWDQIYRSYYYFFWLDRMRQDYEKIVA